LLPGREPAHAELSDNERIDLGAALGRFLRVLHDAELDVDLPDDPIRRADMPFRLARLREKLAAIGELAVWSPPPAVRRILADADRLPPSTDRVLAHGDLHVRHVLVDHGVLSGVIDWGDVCRSDPAVDLMLVWSLLPPAGRVRFSAEYGPIDEAGRLRARVLALFLGVTLAIYAHNVGDAALERECVASLERTLVD
jgi:aminoglycoside phosphotransferase (APT) family kinase protein